MLLPPSFRRMRNLTYWIAPAAASVHPGLHIVGGHPHRAALEFGIPVDQIYPCVLCICGPAKDPSFDVVIMLDYRDILYFRVRYAPIYVVRRLCAHRPQTLIFSPCRVASSPLGLCAVRVSPNPPRLSAPPDPSTPLHTLEYDADMSISACDVTLLCAAPIRDSIPKTTKPHTLRIRICRAD